MSKSFTPHPYQERGISVMTTQPDGGAGLLLDPGMGKTIVTLLAFDLVRNLGYASKMLVVAPIKPMYDTWPSEILKWDETKHLTITVLHGDEKEEALDADTDIYVINPEGLKWLLGHAPHQLPDFDVLAVDESTKFKNSTAKRFKSLKKVLHWFKYRWILTGTVAPNGLMDLFGQSYIMDLGEGLGRFITHYRNKYFFQSGFGGYTYTPFDNSFDEITDILAPRVLKLDAEDHLDMPELNIVDRPVLLPPEAMVVYKEVEKEFISGLATGTIVAANAGAAGTKCRQIANGSVYDEDGVAHFVHDAKMDALDELLEETNGHPLLIFYEYGHDRDRLMERLGKEAVCVTGVAGTKLKNINARFNAGEIPYLIMHPGSSHGLNIHGSCSHMVWFGITWNLEDYIQAIWRLYRQGQNATMVMCYRLIALGTYDERVVDVLLHKGSTQDKLEDKLMAYRG